MGALLCSALLIRVKSHELSVAAAKGIPKLKAGSVPYLLSPVAQEHTQREAIWVWF